MNKKPLYLLLTLFVFVFTACGGGGDDSGTEPAKPELGNGVLLDSAVQGVAYRSGALSGFTGPGGEYEFEVGKPVTFSIGDLVIGTVTEGSGVLTPLDFGSLQLAINVANLLQSIDKDAVPANGIVIIDAMHTALTGSGASINFDQANTAFASDTAVQAVLDSLAPHTDAGVITLRTDQQTIVHLSTELHLDILEVDVVGKFELKPADAPQSPAIFEFNADKSGARIIGTTTINTSWDIDSNNKLVITNSTNTGLPSRLSLISGTLDDGVIAAEVDADQDGVYELFTLLNITWLSATPPDTSGGTPGTLCGVAFDTDVSANIATHSLNLPINSNWNFEPYTTTTSTAEYFTFATDVYNGIPSTRVDTYDASTDTVKESLWVAIAMDGAVYDLNTRIGMTDYPCSTPNMRFPATITTGITWPINVESFTGVAEIVSTNTDSPAGYTNTIKISQTFDFGGGDVVVFDNYYRIGEGLLDKSDNMSQWLKRTDITPENPPPATNGNGFGTLTLSAATIAADSGAFEMDSSISSGTVSYSWSGAPGAGITVVVTTSLGTVSMSAPSGTAYACSCQPVIDLSSMTATFTNLVLTDTFPSTPGPTTNSLTLNGTLVIP